MIVFPNCKINLGLRILRKRTDGYHDLETLFYPLPLYDVLEGILDTGYGVRNSDNNRDESPIQFSSSGFSINGNVDDNLCVKAYKLLKNDFAQLPPVQMHLQKTIPAGAGLGGGSADAAFTLKLLNQKFDLHLSSDQLIHYALQLGSDCPFFIINTPCLATGRGEILEQLTLDLSAYKFVIVNPAIPINTTHAFSEIIPALPEKALSQIIQQPVATWKDEVINDFEKTVFIQHPEIEAIKNQLYDGGAVYASMSGSGSTVYGVFKKETPFSHFFPTYYFFKQISF